MSIKLSLSEIVTMRDSIVKFVNQDMPIKISFKISKFVKKIQEEIEIFEEQRMKLLKKYGEEKEKQITVKEKNVVPFQEEISELLKEEAEFDFEPINIDKLGEKIELSPQDMLSLEKIIVSEDEETILVDLD